MFRNRDMWLVVQRARASHRSSEIHSRPDTTASTTRCCPGVREKSDGMSRINSAPCALWTRFSEAVRAGRGEAQFGKFDHVQQQLFSAGVEAFTAPIAAALGTAYDFSRHRRLLDVAGGTGSFLLAVLRQYPALKGTLFELPGACAVARATIVPGAGESEDRYRGRRRLQSTASGRP